MAGRERRWRVLGLASTIALAAASTALAQTARPSQQVVVTASRADLLGKALTASQGVVTKREIELRPIYRVGQLLETMPGLVVTVHSGEGKANQYLVRGFNLDHGTDIATFVDGMPVNRPTNAHGQGYSDLNFLMPQIASSIDYAKGPYQAQVGNFGAVASVRVHLIDELTDQVSASVGTLGDQNLFIGGTRRFDDQDRLWAAVDVGHVDGPWDPPGDFRKIDAATRFSHGSASDGYSLTAMYYKGDGRLETDQPLRAVQEGLIGRFGVLDPSDASRSERWSLSARDATGGAGWSVTSNAYYVHSTMTLWNDFTHVLYDRVNGDQEEQDERRDVVGGDAVLTLDGHFGRIESDTTFGLEERYDDVLLDRKHTKDRVNLFYCEEAGVNPGPGAPYAVGEPACNEDRVHLSDTGAYAQNLTHWTSWLRTDVGLREELYWASDHSLTPLLNGTPNFSASAAEWLLQPRGSVVLGPFFQTEVYLSAGRGFHSDDVRGVFGTVPLEGIPATAGKTPLLAPATSAEVGVRSDIIPRLKLQVAVFQVNFNSELAYDQDQGEDTPGAPSRRQGVEISAQYRPFSWIELNADLAVSRARYRGDLAAFGLSGPFIANAPTFIGSLGAIVDGLGPWYGGLQWRRLGPYPVTDGPQYPQSKGYSEVNLDVGYKLTPNLKAQVSVFNLFNSKDEAAVYDYTARLPGEPAEGVDGLQVHPLEPISARFQITATF